MSEHRISEAARIQQLEMQLATAHRQLGAAVLQASIKDLEIHTLRKQTELDPKTGVLNSSAFIEKAQKLIGYQHREHERGTSHVLAFLDIDDFKKLNTALGETVADERVLLPFVSILKSRVREDDLVGRFGGEEFTLLLRNTDADHAKLVLSDILQGINTLPIEGWDQPVGASVGMLEVSQGTSVLDALNKVNSAEHLAKQNGKNRIEEWLPNMGV